MTWYHENLGFLASSASFTLNGNNYPANWLAHTDTASRQRIGFFPVKRPTAPNPKFYDVQGETVEIVDGEALVKLEIVPRDLAKLKSQFCGEIKTAAGSLISQSGADWMGARAEQHKQLRENQLAAGVTPEAAMALKPIPQAVLDFANAVREASNQAEQLVLDCATVDELAALVLPVWPKLPE